MTKPAALSFDGWTLHAESGELTRGDKKVRLQELSLQILMELLCRPGELVTREQLIAKLWPQGVVDFENGLNTAVSKLRTALGDGGDGGETPRYIETIPRKGYRFIGKLSTEVAPTSGSTRRSSLLWLSGALVVAIALGVLATSYFATPTPARLRLAVLPFENLSPDASNAFFAEGLHEEVLGTLAVRVSQMDVISRTTMLTYRTQSKSAPEIAKELNVTHVLEGSVHREGQDVRVSLQLIDARSDKHLWSNNYDRHLTNAMTLQSQIAMEVASQLSVQLSPQTDELPTSTLPEAYDLFLRAKLAVASINQWTTPEQVQQVEQWLDGAIGLDAAFAAAYVERAQLRIIKFVLNFDVSDINAQAAHADIAKARDLAGDHPNVVQVDSRYAAAIESNQPRSRRLLELPQVIASRNPIVMRWRAFALCRQGSPDQGFAVFAQLNELDPGNAENVYDWSRALRSARRGADALHRVQAFNKRGVGKIDTGDLLFAFTGITEPLRNDIERMSDSAPGTSMAGTAIDPDTRLAASFDLLRYERRFAELTRLLSQSPAMNGAIPVAIRPRGFREPTAPGIGGKPLAALHGWIKLLNGDVKAAAIDGRTVLTYVGSTTNNYKRGAGYLHILKAEGELLLGNKTQAIAEARIAQTMFPTDNENTGRFARRFAAADLARIFAWSGAENEAVQLLEELSTKFPMLGPAEITRDPLYSIPLKNNARYKVLEKKLEAEIAENQLLFATPTK